MSSCWGVLSSRSELFCKKKDCSEKIRKINRKMRVRVSYLSIKYKLQDYYFILKRLQRSCFHVNLRNFSEQLFIEHLRTTASAQWTLLKILENFLHLEITAKKLASLWFCWHTDSNSVRCSLNITMENKKYDLFVWLSSSLILHVFFNLQKQF